MSKTEFNKLLKNKTSQMYDDNLLSKADIDDLNIFKELFYLAYQDNSRKKFADFEKEALNSLKSFTKKRIDNYKNNEYALEVCKHFYRLNSKKQ